MPKVKCLLIDDEKNSRDNLATLIETYCPQLEILGKARNGAEGLELISDLVPDVIFLDIHMPDFDGFSLLKKLEAHKPMVVFVTAYENYALKALKASAIDYLLKPVSIKELQATALKLQEINRVKNENPSFINGYHDALKLMIQNVDSDNPQRLALSDHSGYRFEDVSNIVRLESDSNYTTLFFKNGSKNVVSKPLKHFEDFLDPKVFLRIHNSHIINVSFLKSYIRDEGGIAELSDGTRINIAKRRLPLFLEMIKDQFIKP